MGEYLTIIWEAETPSAAETGEFNEEKDDILAIIRNRKNKSAE